MTFFPNPIQGKNDKIAFVELIWNTGAGKIGSIKGLIMDLAWGSIIIKLFGLERFWFLVPIFSFLYVIGVFLFGFFLYRTNYVFRQGDVNNRLMNPQILRIEEEIKRLKEK